MPTYQRKKNINGISTEMILLKYQDSLVWNI